MIYIWSMNPVAQDGESSSLPVTNRPVGFYIYLRGLSLLICSGRTHQLASLSSALTCVLAVYVRVSAHHACSGIACLPHVPSSNALYMFCNLRASTRTQAAHASRHGCTAMHYCTAIYAHLMLPSRLAALRKSPVKVKIINKNFPAVGPMGRRGSIKSGRSSRKVTK